METREPKTDRLVAESGYILLTPFGTIRRAREFLDAAEFLRARSDRFSPVSGFLACRAVELSLKAFLRARGMPWDEVRLFGHDLAHLLLEAEARGFDQFVALSPAEKEFLLALSSDYANQKWAYFDIMWSVGDGIAPDPTQLGLVSSRIVSTLEPICCALAEGDGTPLTLPPTASSPSQLGPAI